jgi:hypothetical protein
VHLLHTEIRPSGREKTRSIFTLSVEAVRLSVGIKIKRTRKRKVSGSGVVVIFTLSKLVPGGAKWFA